MTHVVVLVHHRFDGRRFRNHVQVGPIKNETEDTTHLIGFFRKSSDDNLSNDT